jgi:HAD superfamily phosphatase
MTVPQPSPSNPSIQAIVIFDIDGVVRDVGQSYRRALADTVEHYTQGAYRPSQEDIDRLKAEGIWNNDWRGSEELTYRYWESQGQSRQSVGLNYEALVDYFQRRYRGQVLEDPQRWDGYISQEPLLMGRTYLEDLEAAGYGWGFFSGATQGSARYVLQHRIGLVDPPLVAMEDAPEKPDPQGLFQAVQQVEQRFNLTPQTLPVVYAGDTVADLYTVNRAREQAPQRRWLGVGVLPPHVQQDATRQQQYSDLLTTAGAEGLVSHIEHLTPALLGALLADSGLA